MKDITLRKKFQVLSCLFREGIEIDQRPNKKELSHICTEKGRLFLSRKTTLEDEAKRRRDHLYLNIYFHGSLIMLGVGPIDIGSEVSTVSTS